MINKREVMATDSNAQHENTESQYKWYRDRKIVGVIMVLWAIIMQIFAFLQVPLFSTIHGYTIGMLMGYYNPLFYVAVIYWGLILLFGERMRLPKYVKLTPLTYTIVTILILFIVSSTGYYQTKNGWTSVGGSAWKAIDKWFDDFTTGPWYAPANTNGGIIGALLYSLFAMITSGIGALVVALVGMLITVSYMVSGSSIGFYRQLMAQKRETTRIMTMPIQTIADEDERDATQDLPLRPPVEHRQIRTQTQELVIKQVVEPDIKDRENKGKQEKEKFPFEDPFD